MPRSDRSSTETTNPVAPIIGMLSRCLSLLSICCAASWAQSVQITSPTDGSVFAPGDTISVSVSVQGGPFATVSLLGDHVGMSGPLNASPYSFTLAVPASVIGQLQFTGVGTTTAGAVVFSNPVTVTIAPAVPLVNIVPNLTVLRFQYIGQTIPLSVGGIFTDGSMGNVTRSPRLAISSADPTIATVASDGTVKAVGPGNTTLTMTYNSVAKTVPVFVPKASRGDLDGDGDVDQDDVNIILSFRGASATAPADARDLNNDGIIDDLDVAIIKTLCTRPNCSTSSVQTLPRLTWATPASIVYGTALSGTQLNAAASVPGTLVYTPSVGTVLGAGNQTLSVIFTPIDVTRYGIARAAVRLQVTKATPAATWARPADIKFGTALGSGQLSATASVPGTFVYVPKVGTVLPVGNGQMLSAGFTPADTADYTAALLSTPINVLPSTTPGVQIIITNSLSRDANKNIVVQLTLANAGATVAPNVTLSSVKIGSVSGGPLPQTIGTIGSNSLAQAIVTVPSSAGASGAASSLTITGTYTGGTVSVTARITLP